MHETQVRAITNCRKSGLPAFALFACSLFFLFSIKATRAQSPAAHRAFAYDALQQFHLIAPGVGWATTSEQTNSTDCQNCSNEHLYWTDNNGKNWRDITPPRTPLQNIDQALFLSDGHGWAALQNPRIEDDKVINLVRTSDGGSTWETMPALSAHALGFMDETAPGPIYFSDDLHGWMFWSWAAASTRADYLIATADGGRTWRKLLPPPGGGPIQFVSAADGWMIGVLDHPAPGFRGTDPVNAQLWVTHDGARSWRPVPIPLPPVPQSQVPTIGFDAMNLKSALEGTVVLRIQFSRAADPQYRYFTCATSDGGRNWRISPLDSKRSQPSIVGSHIVWFTPAAGTRNVSIQGEGDAAPSSVPAFLWPGGSAIGSFVDDTNGWIVYSARPTATNAAASATSQSDPLAAMSSLLGLGQGEKELLATTDGGKTFRVITPPAGDVASGANPALPPPEIDSLSARTAAPGSSISITGRAFSAQNTVTLGPRELMADSQDGEHLRVPVPADLPSGSYQMVVSNTFGKSNSVPVTVTALK